MHHGSTGDATQFCSDATFVSQAQDFGLALVCTSAPSGKWDLEPCAASHDVRYVQHIVDWLAMAPERFDMARLFQAGFSQGALFAAQASFCLAQYFVGFGQSGSSAAPHRLSVPSTSPPLRACIWVSEPTTVPHCARASSACFMLTSCHLSLLDDALAPPTAFAP